jgi:hypothetical protein
VVLVLARLLRGNGGAHHGVGDRRQHPGVDVVKSTEFARRASQIARAAAEWSAGALDMPEMDTSDDAVQRFVGDIERHLSSLVRANRADPS